MSECCNCLTPECAPDLNRCAAGPKRHPQAAIKSSAVTAAKAACMGLGRLGFHRPAGAPDVTFFILVKDLLRSTSFVEPTENQLLPLEILI